MGSKLGGIAQKSFQVKTLPTLLYSFRWERVIVSSGENEKISGIDNHFLWKD